MGMKLCSKCGIPKDPSEFGPSKKTKDGLKTWCLLCCRDYSRRFARTPEQKAKRKAYYEDDRAKLLQQAKQRWETNREAYEPARQRWAEEHREEMLQHQRDRAEAFREFIRTLKEGKPCMDCGDLYPYYVMEYDHVRGKKRHNIAKMANHKRDRVIEEIAKCDLVCCVCHRIRTHARRKPPKTPKLVAFREWMAELKAKPCRDCGRVRPPEAMDFHHVRGEKVAQITDMWSWGREKVLVELEKCDLICANCHREQTIRDLYKEGVLKEPDVFDLFGR